MPLAVFGEDCESALFIPNPLIKMCHRQLLLLVACSPHHRILGGRGDEWVFAKSSG
jgi:hypothetical protein